jgi:hypothetical protein
MSSGKGFHIAPFGIDGRLEGEGFWSYEQLSTHWIDACGEVLEELGPIFEHQWSGPLSFVRTKLTSTDDYAIVTIYIRDHIASSLVFLRGSNRAVEDEARTTFLKSLANTELVRAAASHSGVACPFEQAGHLADRPLMIPVSFPNEALSDEDFDLARELSIHLAGAFFQISETVELRS